MRSLPFGLDIVDGEIIGEISHRYSATFVAVEEWPKHGSRFEYPPRVRGFWSELTSRRDAIEEYKLKNRRESKLGDGSPVIYTLKEAKGQP